MTKTLRILHLEDSPADVEQVRAQLARAGIEILSELGRSPAEAQRQDSRVSPGRGPR